MSRVDELQQINEVQRHIATVAKALGRRYSNRAANRHEGIYPLDAIPKTTRSIDSLT